MVGSQLDANNWNTFQTGTEECLGTIQGNNGVPLSYMLWDETNCSIIVATLTHDDKIFWNAPFTGPDFEQYQLRVWTYLAQRCIDTPGWQIIKTYQRSSNARQAWLDLSLFYGGAVESTRKMTVACAVLKELKWSNEQTF